MTLFDRLSLSAQLPILQELAVQATQRYSLPSDLDTSLINLSENATYSLQAKGGARWAMRIHREGYHPHAAIASELAWIQDLRANTVVDVPELVAGSDGKFIQTVRHPAMENPRHIVLSHWESGAEPGISSDLHKPFEMLGEATARLHGHARNWQRPAWFARHSWTFDNALGETAPHWGRWRDGIGVDATNAKLFGRTVDLIGKRLAAYGQDEARFGLIHGDLRLANVLLDAGSIKVIDFDDCGFGWYMYDVATTVSFFEHEPQVPDLIEAWKTGYRKVVDLPKADEAEIPTFVMLRRLLLVAWIGSHSETDLARSMGSTYTDATCGLCESYLSQLG